jgi:hypothetical protein
MSGWFSLEVLTLVLVLITGYYAYQTRAAVRRCRRARRASACCRTFVLICTSREPGGR